MRKSWVEEEPAYTKKQRRGQDMWRKNQETAVVIKAKGRQWFDKEGEVKNYVKWKVKNMTQKNFDYEVGIPPCFVVFKTYK